MARAKNKRTLTLIAGAAVLAAVAWAPAAATAAGEVDETWPCEQAKVPTISAGAIWAGPAIDETDESWRKSPALAGLVETLSQRRLAIDKAQAKIDGFAGSLGADRGRQLSLLFVGLLQTINTERSAIIAGIERYAEKQRMLADKIMKKEADLSVLHRKSSLDAAEKSHMDELEKQLTWDTRVFEEREHSLTYVCEAPVLLEQRLFQLSRQIVNDLQD